MSLSAMLAAAALTGSLNASAEFRINLVAYVPVVCSAGAVHDAVASGQTAYVVLDGACNSPHDITVTVDGAGTPEDLVVELDGRSFSGVRPATVRRDARFTRTSSMKLHSRIAGPETMSALISTIRVQVTPAA
jgi:hypothetical protein